MQFVVKELILLQFQIHVSTQTYCDVVIEIQWVEHVVVVFAEPYDHHDDDLV